MTPVQGFGQPIPNQSTFQKAVTFDGRRPCQAEHAGRAASPLQAWQLPGRPQFRFHPEQDTGEPAVEGPTAPLLLWEVRHQRCDVEKFGTSVCPREGEARGRAARTTANCTDWAAPPRFVNANEILTTRIPLKNWGGGEQ